MCGHKRNSVVTTITFAPHLAKMFSPKRGMNAKSETLGCRRLPGRREILSRPDNRLSRDLDAPDNDRWRVFGISNFSTEVSELRPSQPGNRAP